MKSWGHCDGTCTQDNFFDKDMNEVGLVVEKEIQEFEEEEDKEDPTVCLCVPLDECSWATRLTRATKYLSRRHPVFVRAKHFISKRVCPTVNRQVHCCEKGTTPPPTTTTTTTTWPSDRVNLAFCFVF